MPTSSRKHRGSGSEQITTSGSESKKSHSEHDLYKTGDPDAPDSIKDSNGEVALGLCRRCKRAERELEEPCIYIKSVGPSSVVMNLGTNPAGPGADTLAGGVRWDKCPDCEGPDQVHGNDRYDCPTCNGSSLVLPSKLSADITSVPRRHDNDWPLWQGPCGEGPLGGITQSMLVRFLSCRERFRLKYVLGLEPPDKWNHRIGYGNMWHACEEALARGQWHTSHLEYHTQSQLSKYPLQQEEILKWHNVCSVQFPEYVKYWSEHPDVQNRTPMLQEKVFDVPYTLPSGRVVRLRGKWDSVDLIEPGECNCGADRTGPSAEAHSIDCPARGSWTFRDGCWHGGIYLQENKTKGDIDRLQVERQLKFDLQTMMYIIALVYNRGDNGLPNLGPICGVRYNVIRRPLSGGKGNIKPHGAKSTKTKFTPAETADEFYERLRRDYIAADPGYWFFRVRVEISAKDVQVFRDTCLDPLLECLCDWYDWNCYAGPAAATQYVSTRGLHYRTPFGVYSALEEGGATEYDAYLETGSEAGLRRVETLFKELQ